MEVSCGDAAGCRMPGERGDERRQGALGRQGVGVQADDEILGGGRSTDRIHQFLPGVADTAPPRRPAAGRRGAVDDAEVQVRDVGEQLETGLVPLANGASIGVVLPGLRLVDASPSDESHPVLLPKRIEAAGKVLDLVLNRDGYVDSHHS